jgi:hypothetical protein
MNPREGASTRPYSKDIKRCEEMEVKLEEIEKLL